MHPTNLLSELEHPNRSRRVVGSNPIWGSDFSKSTCLLEFLLMFKLAAVNIVSLQAHIDELRVYMHSKVIDILAINESRLSSSISNGEVSIPGYILERYDRNRDGGGVALYIRNTINYELLHDYDDDSLEWLVCCTYTDTFFCSVIVLVILFIINFRFMASRFRSLCDVVDLDLRFSVSIACALS